MSMDTDIEMNGGKSPRKPDKAVIDLTCSSSKPITKKRCREEMEVDGNTPCKAPPSAASTSTTTATTATNCSKKRKIVAEIPAKWHVKFEEYQNAILSQYQTLQQQLSAYAHFDQLLRSDETRQQLQQLQRQFSQQSQNNNNDNDGGIDIHIAGDDSDDDAHLALIAKLCYAQHKTLSELCTLIRSVLMSDTDTNDSDRENASVSSGNVPGTVAGTASPTVDQIRSWILRASQRKLYGVAPSKSVDKNEEETIVSQPENVLGTSWERCRVYVWEPLNAAHLPASQFQLDVKALRHANLVISKYATFCKKYQVLHAKAVMSGDEKHKQLQKIDDSIIAWHSKQQQRDRERVLKEENLRRKKEENALKKQQQKPKKEEKTENDVPVPVPVECSEHSGNNTATTTTAMAMDADSTTVASATCTPTQTPIAQKRKSFRKTKKRASFLDQWVKSTPVASSEKSLYEQIFLPPKSPATTSSMPSSSSVIHVDLDSRRLAFSRPICVPRPTALPAVFCTLAENNNNPCDVSLESDLSRIQLMQIDHDPRHNHNHNHKLEARLKIQCKFRLFAEDYRGQYFGANPAKYELRRLGVDVRKLCRSPLMRLPLSRDIVDYDAEDSGVEYAEDGDGADHADAEGGDDEVEDAEDLGDDDEDDEEENAVLEEQRRKQREGRLRGDGYEDDAWIDTGNGDGGDGGEEEEEGARRRRKNRQMQELRHEYPIGFAQDRLRGDEFDAPIVVQLPTMCGMARENTRLYALMLKKAILFVEELECEEVDGNGNENEMKQNDLEFLLQSEQSQNEKMAEKEKKKKKQKVKEDKIENKTDEKNETGTTTTKKKMETDEEEQNMTEKQSTLNCWLKVRPKEENENSEDKEAEQKEEKEIVVVDVKKQPQKKKKRVVVCEFIE